VEMRHRAQLPDPNRDAGADSPRGSAAAAPSGSTTTPQEAIQ
jgi:hypothetical protein